MTEIQFDSFNEIDETMQIVGETENILKDKDISYLEGFKAQNPDLEFKIGFNKIFKSKTIFEEGPEFSIELDENKEKNDKIIFSKPKPEIIEKKIKKKKIKLSKILKQEKTKCIEPNEFKLFNQNKNLKNLQSHYEQKCFFCVKNNIEMSKKRKRGIMRDNISKKIKVNFSKNIILSLNRKLRKKNICKFFHRLDQSDITDVTKKNNERIFERTLKEIINEKPKVKDKENAKKMEDKWKQNINLIEELEKSGDEYFKHILEMNMEELFNEYLVSKEFEESIYDLKNGTKKFYFDYIQNYIRVAKNYVNFYKNEEN